MPTDRHAAARLVAIVCAAQVFVQLGAGVDAAAGDQLFGDAVAHAARQQAVGAHAGEQVEQDFGQVVHWYGKAAAAGDANAQSELGTMYLQGQGVVADLEKAVALFTGAAEAGDPMAQTNLAYCYSLGRGVAKDESVAIVWREKAAEQGFVIAISTLAGDLAWGEGEGDVFAAYKWYRIMGRMGLDLCEVYGNSVTAGKRDLRGWLKDGDEEAVTNEVTAWMDRTKPTRPPAGFNCNGVKCKAREKCPVVG